MAFSVIFSFEDEGEPIKRSTMEIFIPTGFSLAQYAEFGQSVAILVDTLSKCVLTKAEFCYTADLSGLTNNSAASATSNVEDVGAWEFVTVDGYPVKLNVPCWDEQYTAAGSDDIDRAAVPVMALEAAIVDGINPGAGLIQPTDIDSGDIVGVTYARERHRNRKS